jgi:diguanylate cyclase (GGDEF)-like protein
VPTLAVLVLVAVMLVQAASWRMMARTLQADEPARLVLLVGLERSLEALQDAVLEKGANAPVDNVTAARAAVVERLRRLRNASTVGDGVAVVDVTNEVERALVTVRAWQTQPTLPSVRRTAEAAVARAHASVRAAVLALQPEALAWSRDVDRQIAWILKMTLAFWVAVVIGGVGLGLAFARLRRHTGRRLQLTEQALVRSEHLAGQDPLTGIANRRRLDGELDAAGRAAAAGGPPFALHLLDVDDLKGVNDRWGHAAGDVLLAAVTRALTSSVRTGDVVGRFGGDEFLVIQRDATAETAEVLAQRLRDAVATPVSVRDGASVVPRVSAGSALYGADGGTPSALLDTADARLYRAKPAKSRATPERLRLVPSTGGGVLSAPLWPTPDPDRR